MRATLSRRWTLLVGSLGLLGILAGAWPTWSAEPIPIRAGWQPGTHPRTYALLTFKLLEKAGLQPEWIKFAAGPPMLSALQSDSLDVAVLGAVPVIFGLSQGQDLKILAVEQDGSNAEGLVVKPGRGIDKLADLKGKRVGVTFGSSSYMAVLQALDVQGLKPADLSLLDMGPPVLFPAFVRGDLDAAWTWDPWLAMAESEGGKLIMTNAQVPTEAGRAAGYGVWVARSDWVAKNPEATRRFIRGLDLAATEVEQSKAALAKAMAEVLGTKEAIALTLLGRTPVAKFVDQVGRSGAHYYMGTPETKAQSPYAQALRALVDFLHEQKRIPTKPDVVKALAPEWMVEYLAQKR